MSQSIPPRIGAFFCARLQVQVGAISIVALWGCTPSPECRPWRQPKGTGPILLRSSTNQMNLVIERILRHDRFSTKGGRIYVVYQYLLSHLESWAHRYHLIRSYMYYELSLTSRMAIDELAVFKAYGVIFRSSIYTLYCQESDQTDSSQPSNTIIPVAYSMRRNDLPWAFCFISWLLRHIQSS